MVQNTTLGTFRYSVGCFGLRLSTPPKGVETKGRRKVPQVLSYGDSANRAAQGLGEQCLTLLVVSSLSPVSE